MRSSLYTGWVRHRRDAPVINHFSYPLYMASLDLDELDRVFADRWLWSTSRPAPARFRRGDYLGQEEEPLKKAVLDLVEEELGLRPQGPVVLLTHLRYYGYIFNPVSFYFCHGIDKQSILAIVAEITNTPWGERYTYVLPCLDGGENNKFRFNFSKAFHISPFMSMNQQYEWRFFIGDKKMVVHMQNNEEGKGFFDATLVLKRREITGPALARVLVEYPFMTGFVITGIYWQALKLWLKGAPYYPHPEKLETEHDHD